MGMSIPGSWLTCSSCRARFPPDERYCGACGYDSQRDDHIEAVLEPKLRQARGWILVVGVLYAVSALLQVTVIEPRPPKEAIAGMLMLPGALFIAHVGLWWWARTAPLAAALVALVVSLTLLLVQLALDPSSVGTGIIIKALFLVALLQAVRAGVQVERLRGERS